MGGLAVAVALFSPGLPGRIATLWGSSSEFLETDHPTLEIGLRQQFGHEVVFHRVGRFERPVRLANGVHLAAGHPGSSGIEK